MKDLQFEWDERKAASNRRKHGVSFEEARSVFLDEDALQIPDPEHSGAEDRFVILGLSNQLRTLVGVPLLSFEGRGHPHHLSAEG